jgi:hypothetical protein
MIQLLRRLQFLNRKRKIDPKGLKCFLRSENFAWSAMGIERLFADHSNCVGGYVLGASDTPAADNFR